MRTLIAIPVFNEARTLSRVLDAVRRAGNDVLVVDDGSTDATAAILAARADVAVITHRENRGYGQSLIDAFKFASCRGDAWVITLDCDEQHEPAQIPDFVREIERDDADVISGSRYLASTADDDEAPADRREINQVITNTVNRVLNLRLTDSFCGFKAHRVTAMRRLALDEPGYAFPLQFWVQCARAGLRIKELPVRRIYRDTSRTFPGTLENPSARLTHYLEVFVREVNREAPAPARSCSDCGAPRAIDA